MSLADGVRATVPDLQRWAAFPRDGKGGNPAGILLSAAGMDEVRMQEIATVVGFPETAFVLSDDGSSVTVRFFSPAAEVPFCGHATVATAFALAARDGVGVRTFETRVGPVVVTTREAGDEVVASFASVEPRTATIGEDVLARLLTVMGLKDAALDETLPVLSAFAGNVHPVLALADRPDFDGLAVDAPALAALMVEQEWTGTVTVVHRTGEAEFEARNLFPVGDHVEDPATGSAAAAFGGYLRAINAVPASRRITILQGHHIGAPCRIEVTIPVEGGIVVAGTARRIDGSDGDARSAPADVTDEVTVENERAEMRAFVKGLSGDDIKTGTWFSKLLAHALATYTRKVDWKYFQERYQGVPPDTIVDQRIKMAARYASIEGLASASAYSAAIISTIGTLGGASPIALPAAGVTLLVDVAFITQLQIRLAYDISVLYGVPLDIDDPEDLWKLIRVAFTIKSGEVAREGINKAVPLVLRPLIKKYYSGAVLQAGRSLPIVGKYLLQRNVIKVGLPLVGVPLAGILNHVTTKIAGRHARLVFRNEARVIEIAMRLTERTKHPRALLWVAWLVIRSDEKTSDDEALLIRHLARLVKERHGVTDKRLLRVVNLQPDDVWEILASAEGDLGELTVLAREVAEVDGPVTPAEQAVIDEVTTRCDRL